tara:strand:+ start:52 stop:891 length:840 start_codon:yes stop_codon:yes gene_type:complete
MINLNILFFVNILKKNLYIRLMFKNFIEQFVFFPQKNLNKNPNNINISYENIYLKYNNIYNIHGWYIENKNKNNHKIKSKVILFFHGNAGNISFRLNYIKKLYEIGFSLMFYDYPGFGLSEGNPNEENCVKTGKMFYEFLMIKKKYKHENIIFYGESIGGAISANLANIVNIKHLILQSTFSDIKKIIHNLSINNYLGLIVENIGFETIKYLESRYKKNLIAKKMKTMIIHSKEDEIIDIKNAMDLSIYSNKFHKSGGSHSNIDMDNDLIYSILEFILD